ncbi:hypothetical protein F5884DRAFT_636397, partial [Xylogone sp. PMI_703]
SPSANKQQPRGIIPKNFCQLLGGSYGQARVCLKVEAGSLWQLHDAEEIDHHIVPGPSVSLAQVFRTRRLSTKMKIILAYIIARSVWQLYDSDWLKTEWTINNIHFMIEQSPEIDCEIQEGQLYACRPCFAFQFNNRRGPELEEYCDAWSIIHRYPRILALGILLLEIGRVSSDDSMDTPSQSLQAKLNNDHTRGVTTLKRSNWPDFDFDSGGTVVKAYKDVVRSCFDTKTLRNMPKDDVQERREYLYKHVVSPLGRLVGDMGWTCALQVIEPM